MSDQRFERINICLCNTTGNLPSLYRDEFGEIREMIEVFNDHLSRRFFPGTQTCIYDSMVSFLSRWSYPGWVNVKRKPYPFGNKYHTIADVATKIIFGIEIVETKKDQQIKGPYVKNYMKIKCLTLLLFVLVFGSQFGAVDELLDWIAGLGEFWLC